MSIISKHSENYRFILTSHEDGIRTITLNRPEKRNALNPELIEELTRALDDTSECDCGVVILAGEGAAFCSGMDMETMSAVTAHTIEEHRADGERMAALLLKLHNFPKPIIAAVNGPAMAAGMALATLCDFTLATPDARFGYTEVKVGFAPAIVAAFLLRQVGERRTRDLLLTGRTLKAPEAVSLGLVTRIVNDGDLIEEARALALTLLHNSPQAMQAVKRMLARHSEHHLVDEIEDGIQINAEQRSTDDFSEGIRAFLEHRKPDWPSLQETIKS